MDARMTDALRVLSKIPKRHPDQEWDEWNKRAQACQVVADYLTAVDAERDARRDEELAIAIVNATNRVNGYCTFERFGDMPNPKAALAGARAARAHIEAEAKR
jgi:hypothetical protein